MLSSILKNLPKLKRAELEQVKQRTNFLLGVTNGAAKEAGHDWLLEGLTGELRRRGLWTGRALPARLLPVDYAAKGSSVRAHLLKGLAKPSARTVERMALGGLAGTVLVDYLTKIRVPVTPKTLLANVEKIPVALEESFPGYWGQGLLGFCIKVKV